MRGGFVDCHSHVLPSGDDGAASVGEGLALCAEARRHGTRILFATPHVWPQLALTPRREAEIRRTYAAVAARADLDLRLGFELTPSTALLEEDPERYELTGTGAVLMEVPFSGPADLLWRLAERTEAAGLRPVIAHPERGEAVLANPALALELAERGWALQLNATSLVGYHGSEVEELAWNLLEAGVAGLVASDGHRAARPARLDEAYEAVCDRLGEEAAAALFDGRALGLALPSAPTSGRAPSRAALPGA